MDFAYYPSASPYEMTKLHHFVSKVNRLKWVIQNKRDLQGASLEKVATVVEDDLQHTRTVMISIKSAH